MPPHDPRSSCPPPTIQALIDTGIKPNQADKLGNMALHLVVEAGGHRAEECARLLLEAKANPDAKGSTDIGTNKTCLHSAVQSWTSGDGGQEQVAMLQLLLKHKADPDCPDKVGVTALHRAARKGAAGVWYQYHGIMFVVYPESIVLHLDTLNYPSYLTTMNVLEYDA